MKKLCITFMLILGFWNPQDLLGQVVGTLQSTAGEPLGFARVVLESNGNPVNHQLTNEQGAFSFSPDTGSYKITAEFIGYQSLSVPIEYTGVTVNLGVLVMKEEGITADEVVITGKKEFLIRKPDRTVLNVQSLVSASGATAIELLERSPGVEVDRVNNAITMMGKSGVIVAINGKRTRLGANDLIQLLSTTPGSDIERIELITHPPASFDAEGDGGVINLVMKTAKGEGFQGEVNAFGGYGERGKFGAGTTLNYAKGKWSAYGNLSVNHNYTNQNTFIDSEIDFGEAQLAYEHENLRPAFIGGYNGRFGLDYALGNKTSLNLFTQGSIRAWELDASASTAYEQNVRPVDRDILLSEETNHTYQYMLSGRFSHDFSKQHGFSIDYDYLNYLIDNPANYELEEFGPDGSSTSIFESTKETPFDFHVAGIDYYHQLSDNHRLEVGGRATISRVENQTSLTYLEDIPVEDEFFTDDLALDEEIWAGYVSLTGKLKGEIEYSVGSRYEYSNFDLNGDTATVKRQVRRFFPTATISKQFGNQDRITLAYRERINRPSFNQLAPAFYFFNVNTVLAGNIQARPNLTKTLELSGQKGKLIASLTYTLEDNPIAWGQAELDREQNLLLLKFLNIDRREQLGTSLTFPINFTSKWTSRYTFNGFYRTDKTTIEGEDFRVRNAAFSVNMQQSFDMGKGWAAELDSRYASRQLQGISEMAARFTSNLGLRKRFSNDATLSLSWQDMFNNGSFFQVTYDLPEQSTFYDWVYQLEGNIVRLTFTYPFGTNRQVRKASRNAGSDEIRQRAG